MPDGGFHLTEAQDSALDDLISPATHNGLGGGSRSGKTFLFVRAQIIRALKEAGSRHVMFRFRLNSIKASVIHDTFPKVMRLCWPNLYSPKHMNKTDWFYTLPNESELWFGGLDDKDRTEKILGQEFATLFFNECSQIPYTSVILALTRLAQKTETLKLKAYYDLNPPSDRHWTHRLFVEKVDPETGQPLADPENYTYRTINPKDNAENLAPEYLRSLQMLPEWARNRFWHGKFQGDTEGALWTEDTFSATRRLGRAEEKIPDFLRIVVAIDPSGCSGTDDFRSDEIGITVTALGTDGHGYLIEDLSGRYSPNEWGELAVNAYKRHSADRIVGEVNYGGAMVEAVVRSADDNVAYSEVHASRGKVVRAEPVAALYEQGKIHHIGYFPEIEEQLRNMTTFGYQGLKSPDRADSAIWGFTELFPGLVAVPKSDKKKTPIKFKKALSR